MVQLLYNSAYVGGEFTTDAYYVGSADLSRFVAADSSMASDDRTHILTGFYFVGNNNIWYQDTLGYWVTGGNFTQQLQANGNGQNLVNTIINNNIRIYENNLLCAYAAKYMTADDVQLLTDLQNRLLIRNQALQNKDLTTNVQESYPKGLINLYARLENIVNNNKVGVVVSTSAMIVISAVVIASVSAAAYFAYMAFANESEEDVKYSDELTAKLVSKLTPEELEQLYKETEGIVTKARLKEKFGTIAGVGSTLLWLLAGGALIYWWTNRTKTKKISKVKKII